MANLGFRTILAHGDIWLGEGMGEEGVDRFDWFSHVFDLPGLSRDLPALLVLATMKADFEKHFITVNAGDEAQVRRQSYEDVKKEKYFVSRILPNPSDTWILQIHRIPARILLSKPIPELAPNVNRIGIHSRNVDGKPVENRDNFGVARIFLFYFGSQ